MPATSRFRMRNGLSAIIAGALISSGLVVPLYLRAQEPGGAGKNSSRAVSKASERPDGGQDIHALRARWRAQQIHARKAEAEYQSARLTREIAEIALLEYVEATFPADRATAEGEIKLAESDLSRAEDYSKWARRISDKGYLLLFSPTSAELTLQKAKFALQVAESKLKVLVDYTKTKTIKELKSEVEKARSVELAKKPIWDREKTKEAELEHQNGRFVRKIVVVPVRPDIEHLLKDNPDAYIIVDGTGAQVVKVKPKAVGERLALPDNEPPPNGAVDVHCLVEGGTTVIKMVPYGSTVKKGQVICELDSAALRDRLTNQQINELSAQSNCENAKLTREVAEVAVTEYVEGLDVDELVEYEMDIKNAEVELSLAEDQLDELKAQKADRKKVVTAELALKKFRFRLERAHSRRKTLVNFSRPKRIKELQSDVEKARSNELAKKASWELEAAKTKKLKRQIEACTIKAPSDGMLVRVTRDLEPGAPTANQPRIEEGSAVRERQLLFRILPPAAGKDD
jgi:hypothetical protein